MELEIRFALDSGAFAPEKAHEWDAGFDLRTPKGFALDESDNATIDTGVHVDIPDGYVGFLKSKSGLNVRFGITGEGVIDAGYTGSIVCKLYRNTSWDAPYVFSRGDKIIQLVILPIPKVTMKEVQLDEIIGGERGSNGFGSTGR